MSGEDLAREVLADLLPGRALRTYPALLSTQADALAWARSGGPEGAVVVADYQASPRGRGGMEFRLPPGRALGFSLILRPHLPADREGWLYLPASCGLADAIGEDARLEWPDEVRRAGERVGAVAVHAELGPTGVDWAVLTVLVPAADPPRGPLLRRAVLRIEERCRSSEREVLDDYLRRCETLGRRVAARLVPMGPGGPRVAGSAVTAKEDGALVLETSSGARVAVRPHHLGVLEEDARPPGHPGAGEGYPGNGGRGQRTDSTD